MVQLFSKHTVRDFDKWSEVFNGDFYRGMMDAGGVTGRAIYRSIDKPQEVTVVQTFESIDAAKAYLKMSGMNDRMAAAGVVGTPMVWLAELV